MSKEQVNISGTRPTCTTCVRSASLSGQQISCPVTSHPKISNGSWNSRDFWFVTFFLFLRISKLQREPRLGLRGGRVGEGGRDGNLASEWPRYLIDGLFKQTATHTSPCGTVPQRPRLKHGAWTQDKHKGDPRGESDRQGNTFLYHISKPRHLFLHPTPRSEKSRRESKKVCCSLPVTGRVRTHTRAPKLENAQLEICRLRDWTEPMQPVRTQPWLVRSRFGSPSVLFLSLSFQPTSQPPSLFSLPLPVSGCFSSGSPRPTSAHGRIACDSC